MVICMTPSIDCYRVGAVHNPNRVYPNQAPALVMAASLLKSLAATPAGDMQVPARRVSGEFRVLWFKEVSHTIPRPHYRVRDLM